MKTEQPRRVDPPRRPLRVRTDLRAGLVPPAPIRPPQWTGDIEIGKGV